MGKVVLMCVALAAAIACGRSEPAAGTAPGDHATAAQDAAASGASGAASSAAVVPHEKLQALLPVLPGWTRGEPKGETVAMGVAVSRVQVEYNKDDASLSFELMDVAMNQTMLAPLMTLIQAGHSERTSDGYAKATTVAGFPASEEWTTESKHGEVSVLVANRFVVKAIGDSVPDVATIRKAVEAIDLKKLAALR